MRQTQPAIALKEQNGRFCGHTLQRKDSKSRIADLPQLFLELRQKALLVAEELLTQLPTLYEICNEYMQRVVDLCSGNGTRAARILGIGKTTLFR